MECQQLNLILDAGVGKNAMLAMRILTSSGKIYLEYVVNKVKEELEKSESEGGGGRLAGTESWRMTWRMTGSAPQRWTLDCEPEAVLRGGSLREGSG